MNFKKYNKFYDKLKYSQIFDKFIANYELKLRLISFDLTVT